MAKSSLTMKLLIDTESKRVLFAEANNDCVEILFHILSLPVAKVISLIGKQEMVGSVANLYQSLENLNESYINHNPAKDTILKPLYPTTAGISDPFLATLTKTKKTNNNNNNNDPPAKKYYRCNTCLYYNPQYFSDDPTTACRYCHKKMGCNNLQYVGPQVNVPSSEGDGPLVKGLVNYMVLDDLVVRPMSLVSCFTLLNEFNVKDVGVLQEKVVKFGMAEAVKLLKASLETKNVLTHVFLNAAASQEQPGEEKQPVVGKRRRQSAGSRTTQEDGPSMSTSSVEEVEADGSATRRSARKGVKKQFP
ncbi:hypothetical protein CASFOL_028157 [Castilleja foliolosa]|uniref:Uncharacterized protein n=1 Tax=Castilleja foliolosa TaxID=1961234 RepID=A0ABD3CDU8_9LAMI